MAGRLLPNLKRSEGEGKQEGCHKSREMAWAKKLA